MNIEESLVRKRKKNKGSPNNVFRSARTSCTTFHWSGPYCPVCKKNLYHLYTGKYAQGIMRRLIKPTLWPPGIPWMPS